MTKKSARERLGSEIVKRGYSDEEIANIYELARFSLENGDWHRAEAIASGLVEVAPDFAPAWLSLAYIRIQNKAYEAAIQAASQALRVNPELAEAQLFLVACLLTTGDYNSAGTYLGEVGERIESGQVRDPNVIRFYRTQLARFQSR